MYFLFVLVQLFPAVFKHQAWGILHILLEMFSYKMHHIPTHYRIQLLSNLHSLATLPQTNKMQLNLWQVIEMYFIFLLVALKASLNLLIILQF